MRCMRFGIAVFASLLLYLQAGVVAAKDAKPADIKLVEQAKQGLRRLGEQFLDSLKNDNVVAYSQCWVSGSVVYEVVSKKHTFSKAERDEMRNRCLDRDRKIARQFEPLRDRFKELTKDLSRLSLEAVSVGTVRGADGIWRTDFPVVIVRVDPDTIVKIEVDSAAGIGDVWYFGAGPAGYHGGGGCIKIVKNGQSKLLDIITKEEWHEMPGWTIPGAGPAVKRRMEEDREKWSKVIPKDGE